MVDIIPALKASKNADANYITIFTHTEVTINDGETTTTKTTKPPVLAGCRDNKSGSWNIPLTETKTYNTPTNKQESVNNVYGLPSSSQIAAYYHAVAGYLTKPIFLEVIRKNFYATLIYCVMWMTFFVSTTMQMPCYHGYISPSHSNWDLANQTCT